MDDLFPERIREAMPGPDPTDSIMIPALPDGLPDDDGIGGYHPVRVYTTTGASKATSLPAPLSQILQKMEDSWPGCRDAATFYVGRLRKSSRWFMACLSPNCSAKITNREKRGSKLCVLLELKPNAAFIFRMQEGTVQGCRTWYIGQCPECKTIHWGEEFDERPDEPHVVATPNKKPTSGPSTGAEGGHDSTTLDSGVSGML